MNQIIVSAKGREKRMAVLRDGKADQFHIFQPSHQSIVGNIYYGIIQKIEPGMNACFVDIGIGKNGYLPKDQIPNSRQLPISQLVFEGEKIAVQVKKDATDHKGPELTALIEWTGMYLVYIPEGNYIAVSRKMDQAERENWRQWAQQLKLEQEGVILRTSVAAGEKAEIQKEWAALRKMHRKVLSHVPNKKAPALLFQRDPFKEEIVAQLLRLKSGTVIVDDPSFKTLMTSDARFSSQHWHCEIYLDREDLFSAFGLDEEIQKALKQIVWLPSGGYVIIEKTEAMTVIDVNSGKYTGKSDFRHTAFLSNIEAAREIPRQIRLRDISGIILIDFINMDSDKDREQIRAVLEEETAKDPKSVNVLEFTSLGLLQLTRKKTKNSLLETVTEPCPVCMGKGRVLSAASAAFQLERALLEYVKQDQEAVLLDVTEDVKKVFAGEQNKDHFHLENLLKKKIYYRMINKPYPFGEIGRLGSEEEIKTLGERPKKG
ncbi:MAG: ribonuclease E/G [Bacillales bacterium]|nr:ribonuclease E/G [Bacillales bacterium]